MELNLLQEYVFISLDNYRETYQNNSCKRRTRLEAWLTFLSDDRPVEILRLIEEYPEFKGMYEEIYEMCRNMEEFMGLFSKELAILDSNTVEYMIDEMQQEIDAQKEQLSQKDEQLSKQEEQLAMQKARITELEAQLKR